MTSRRPSAAQLLSSAPLFSACTANQLRMLSRIAHRMRVAAGETIVREGERNERFYTIADGTARVTMGRRTMATLAPGDFFGEVALLDPGPRTATVTAATNCTLYAIDAEDFQNLLLEIPTVTVNILRGVARQLRSVDKTLKY